MSQLTQEEAKALAARGFIDPVFFLRFFLPDWFPTTIPWVHRGIMAILLRRTDFLLNFGHEEYRDGPGYWTEEGLMKIVRHFTYKVDPSDDKSEEISIFSVIRDQDGHPIRVDLEIGKYAMVMMPRGFSKTTLANGIVLSWILYQECNFPVYVSETQRHAESQLSNVRGQLESNERILSVFGDLRPAQRVEGKKWTQDIIQTTTGITVAARGRGGQIRGLNIDAQRPDRILMDDIEDKESVATAEQREKVKDWAYGDVMPALPRMDENAMIFAMGTLLHSEALLMTWSNDPDWTSIRVGAVDKDGEALWPANMSLEKIAAVKASYTRAGRLHIYYMEFENSIRNDETAKFKQSFFIYGKAESELFKALAIDPAISDSAGADYCSFGVVGMELKAGRHHVLECHGERGMLPKDQVDEYFRLSKLYLPQRHGVEAVAYQAALVHLLREEMFRRGHYFEIEKQTHTQKKTERVEGILQPRFANGYIIFTKRFPLLEQQLLDWPKSKKDLPDVLAMAIALLDPYAAAAADPTVDLGADEYEDITDELDGDWRMAP